MHFLRLPAVGALKQTETLAGEQADQRTALDEAVDEILWYAATPAKALRTAQDNGRDPPGSSFMIQAEGGYFKFLRSVVVMVVDCL